MATKLREIGEELRTVLAGRSNLLDSIVPPLAFVVANNLSGFTVAAWSAVGVALAFLAYRLLRRQRLAYAAGGIGGVVLAIGLARLLGRAEGYFLPGILSGGLTVLACLVSVIARRPLVAWTSFVTRRWPLPWYWHPSVRPAYSEVTLIWAVFFALRLGVQWALFRGAAAGLLGIVQLLTGWPATIVLLVLSYLYGTWRLRRLRGPSVEEFNVGAEPPWTGQQRGF
ncbi:MAG TPA: DUF3159 domain-containing protein [Anaerolineae bacterium]|nr:DUF3159 domain-containing protein [Anaerolineae bacterium]